MAQLSLRLDDQLHRRATFAARAAGLSLNAYIGRVLRVAVEPGADEPEAERIRTRLAEAGLLPTATPPTAEATSAAEQDAFAAARRRTAGGTAGSDLIAAERDGR